MTNISVFDPMTNQLGRLFQNLIPRDWSFEKEFGAAMKIDVSEDNRRYIVRADLPGVRKEDIHVDIEGSRIAIRAHTESHIEERKGETVIHSERREGNIYRSFELDTGIDQAHAEASFRNGVLELKLPKKSDGHGTSLKIN